MKLNHANLCTNDVVSLSNLFTRHFAFDVLDAGDGYAMLKGTDGFFLVLTKTDPNAPQTYPNSLYFNFHVGFMIETPEAVHAKHQELSEAGWNPGPVKNYEALGAAWTAFYCAVGDGIDVEVNTHSPLKGTIN